MPVTKEMLTARIEDLKRQHEQLVANANAVAGAMQGFQSLLQEVDEAPTSPPPQKSE